MLNNVKSIKVLNDLLKPINYRRTLNIVKYNKSLQSKLSINFVYYKIYCLRYIIFGENGPGKEYCNENHKLVFEGEFLKRKRNGKGKEYSYDDKLIFEGEYLNGKRNGKGKEYYYQSNNLKFEGEYFNDKKWTGKGYDYKGNKIYELNNGKGFIKEYNIFCQLIFESEYLNGDINGKGKEYFNNGNLRYEGLYFNGKKWKGKTYNIFNNIIKELKNGNGFIYEYDLYGELIFEGEYLNGRKNGKGKEYNYDGKLIF